MRLYPAIDLLNKRCVRLFKGNYNEVTDFGDPILMAKKWESEGAKYLHLVNLNGALDKSKINQDIIKQIVKTVNIPVELGGGIRSLEDIKEALDLGVSRVILGSVAVNNQELLKEAIKRYGSDKIVVGVDALNFKVAISGWVEKTEIDALDFCLSMQNLGVKTIIFTDISKDGTLSGVNLEQTKKLIDNTNLEIIASGGVKTIKDLRMVNSISCKGVIIGKALYLNTISFKEASGEFECCVKE